MHCGSESQSTQYNNIYVIFLTACEDTFGFWLSRLVRLLHTHSTVGKMPTGDVVIVRVD